MRAVGLWWPLLAFAACGESELLLALPGDGPTLLVYQVAGALRVSGIDRDDQSQQRIVDPEDGHDSAVLAIVTDASSLSELGLGTGLNPLVAPGHGARRLPYAPPAKLYVADLDAGAFEPLEEPPLFLADVWVHDSRLRRCLEIVETVGSVGLETLDWVNFAVTLEPRRAVLVSREGVVIELGADLVPRRIQVRPELLDPSAMFVLGPELWIATSSGAVYRTDTANGLLSGPLELVATSSGTPIDRLAVTVDDGIDLVVALDRSRRVLRQSGETFEEVFAFLQDSTADRSKALVVGEGGEILAISLSEPKIVRIRGREHSVESPLSPPVSGFNVGAFVPGFGYLLSETFGNLYANQGTRWEVLIRSQVTSVHRGIMPMWDWAFMGNKGEYQLVHPERRDCPPIKSEASLDPFSMTRFSEDEALVAGKPLADSADVPFAIVRKKE
ncbi:MAG: hypothetical protein HYV07_27625 [Deltaproteobacteria bacterium]|nr:hypothetical protein [Deltaproteobacteria bacterium]